MGILLGIDHGTVRTGLALSDALEFLAHPHATVPTEQAPEAIAALVRERGVTEIVLGLPLRADGSEGSAAERVRKFLAQLRPLLPEAVPVVLRDESLTTLEAHERLREAGKKTRDHRPVVDQAAAVIILQEYLDQRQAGRPMAFPEPEPMDPGFGGAGLSRRRQR